MVPVPVYEKMFLTRNSQLATRNSQLATIILNVSYDRDSYSRIHHTWFPKKIMLL